jgi:hypothetical protein
MRRAAIAFTAAALCVSLPLSTPGTGVPVVDVAAIADLEQFAGPPFCGIRSQSGFAGDWDVRNSKM